VELDSRRIDGVLRQLKNADNAVTGSSGDPTAIVNRMPYQSGPGKSAAVAVLFHFRWIRIPALFGDR